jgi:Bacterial PH domain
VNEHEFEAELGLPEPLPANEIMLWQGSPQWWSIACDVLHIRKLLVYFGLLLLWVAASAAANGQGLMAIFRALAWVLPIPAIAVGLLLTGAWLIAKTSVYSITDQRVVMRIGIVLSVTFNLPLRQIQALDLRARSDGTGDIAMRLGPTDQIAYLHMWPHARPWRVRRAEPMLRGVTNAGAVAQRLSATLSASGVAGRPAAV